MRKRKFLYRAVSLAVASMLMICVITCAAEVDGGKGDGRSRYGALSVEGTKLCGEDGSAAVLRGMSSHGLAWFPEYTNYAALRTLRDYGFNVIRIAVYPAQNDGYLEEPELNRKLLYAAIENALAADLYVIVDWHVLQDRNPLKHRDKAKEFFMDVAKRYGQESGIIYEICNEPNSGTTYRDIQKYAGEVIPTIRKYAPDAVISVGTPKFCTTLEDVMKDPLPYENVMYTYHYYSDVSDCRYACSQIGKALDSGIPVFVSEWGYVMESETSKTELKNLDIFLDFLEENGISWVNWALSNKHEKYSFLRKDVTALSGWTEEQLTPSGKYVVSRLSKKTDPEIAHTAS